MTEKKRLRPVVAVALALVCLAAAAAAGNYFFNLAINTRSDKSGILRAEHNALDLGEGYAAKLRGYETWLDNAGYDEWQISGPDNLDLNAYAVLNGDPAGTWVLICHGYHGHGRQMLEPAHEFFRRGYNILLPDGRGYGKSGGAYTGMGWLDRKDMVAWLGEINARHRPRNIVLYGVSMGGATVLMTLGERLPENVRAAISDCGYSSVAEEFAYQLDKLFGLPEFPILPIASLVTRIRAGYWLGDADAAGQVAKATVPILFIHGSADSFVPATMLDKLYAAAGGAKEKLVVEGAGHAGSAAKNPRLYWDTIDAFLAKHLSGG